MLPVAHAKQTNVFIGLTAEFGHRTSTSARAIEMGIQTAIDEVNEAGGVLDGRMLELITRDSGSIPARAVANFRDLAAMPDVVAVFGGKFSPVVLEMAAQAEHLGVPLLDPWAAADDIIPETPAGSFVYRLSLKDSWALNKMIDFAHSKGWSRLGLIVPNNGWGRSSKAAAAQKVLQYPDISIVEESWYNLGASNLGTRYGAMVAKNVDVVLMVANEGEGAQIAKSAASYPADIQIPLLSHWGITGGNFTKLAGASLDSVDLSVVQTFTFVNRNDQRALDVLARTRRIFDLKTASDIPSQVGFSHAYDLTHILANAINLSGSPDRAEVRNALEQVRNYDGLTRYFSRPFSPSSHEALRSEDVFIGRFLSDGTIIPIEP
ncbi:hypothetical protein TMES_16635 [Thalassospira mesophila]|uniref:Leucine-binding protein domain-containing protein n=2 Tax=Thalassospira mesophila TaxID=1293891 RepID=A0A1Y2KXV3_9PROT|nr:hypothetical protein TMES_16635 [Thalassospira mesophila]